MGRAVNLLHADETIGSFLRKNRESQGKGLAEVSLQTRISEAALKAIEDDDRKALPAEVFARGFVKTYARSLGLDPNEALVWFIEQNNSNAKHKEKINIQEVLGGEIMAVASKFPLRPVLASFVTLIIVLSLGYWLVSLLDSPEPVPGQNGGVALQAPATPLPGSSSASLPSSTAGSQPGKELAAGGGLSTAQESGLPGKVAEAGQPAPQAPTGEKQALTQARPDAGGLVLPPGINYVLEAKFTEKTWLSVQTDQNRGTAVTYNPGDSAAWQAREKIALLVGNAGGVTLTLNGKPMPALGRSGESARVSFPAKQQP